ncbi:hypothetical protein TrVE_jg10227 [Triparma verrucosa]|uniref:AB hydrolase-1 domain-containing protein n=1 Tax=Triparma verrucosa TaxID=1606542 RepID=A0A9W7EMI1_9STRA|nr:hypothetical protein TrVE_jg10227 [Triparma verrucosa]
MQSYFPLIIVFFCLIVCTNGSTWKAQAKPSPPSRFGRVESKMSGRINYNIRFPEQGLVSSLKTKLRNRRRPQSPLPVTASPTPPLEKAFEHPPFLNFIHPMVDSATLLLAKLYTGGKSKIVPTSIAPMHVLDIPGSGTSGPIVLLHGVTSCASDFTPLASDLKKKYSRVIAIDLLGHGLTPLPDCEGEPRGLPNFNWMTKAVGEVLDSLIPGHKALLLGNSMGGLVAMRMALERPDKVNGLFLISPAGGPLDQKDIGRLSNIFNIGSQEEGKTFIKRMHGLEPPSGLLHLMAWVARGRVAREEVKQIFASITPENFMTENECKAISVPTALFWGGEEKVLPSSHLDFFRSNIPNVAVCNPPCFGHVPQNDNWKYVSQRCAEFTKTYSGGGGEAIEGWLQPSCLERK